MAKELSDLTQGLSQSADDIEGLASAWNSYNLTGIQPTAQQAESPSEPGILQSGVDSFLHSVGPQNVQMFGAGLRAIGTAMQQESVYDIGHKVESQGMNMDWGKPGHQSLREIDSIGDAMTWASQAIGQGIGSMAVPLATGAAGAAAGAAVGGPAGAVAGGVAGGFSSNFVLLAGETLKQLEESGVDGYDAGVAATKVAPLLSALDTAGLLKVLQGPARDARKTLIKYVAQRIAHGAGVEGATEAAQQAIMEMTDAKMSDDPDTVNRIWSVIEGGAAGALVGGTMGGATAPLAGKVEPKPKKEKPATRRNPRQRVEPTIEEVEETEIEEKPEAFARGRRVEKKREAKPDALPEVVEDEAVEDAPGSPLEGDTFDYVKAHKERRKAAKEAEKKEVDHTALAKEERKQELQELSKEVEKEKKDKAEPPAAAEVQKEAEKADPEPTEAQKESGNYKKGHVKIGGMDVSIENAKGSERKGRDKGGKEWSVTMPAHYGYVNRTEGADGDQLDVYIGDNPESENVFVVDQVDAESKEFDEHKAMVGFDSQEEAEQAYDQAFDDGKGKDRRQTVTPVTMDEFKAWVKDGETKKPFADSEIQKLNKQIVKTEGYEHLFVKDYKKHREVIGKRNSLLAKEVDSFDDVPVSKESLTDPKVAEKISEYFTNAGSYKSIAPKDSQYVGMGPQAFHSEKDGWYGIEIKSPHDKVSIYKGRNESAVKELPDSVTTIDLDKTPFKKAFEQGLDSNVVKQVQGISEQKPQKPVEAQEAVPAPTEGVAEETPVEPAQKPEPPKETRWYRDKKEGGFKATGGWRITKKTARGKYSISNPELGIKEKSLKVGDMAKAKRVARRVVDSYNAKQQPEAEPATQEAVEKEAVDLPVVKVEEKVKERPLPKEKDISSDTDKVVVTPEGKEVKVRPELVELDTLTASHDEYGNENPEYPQQLQPRDRERKASRDWIVDTAAKLIPKKLLPAVESGSGSPIVAQDNVVESGNGRALAIRRAYESNPKRIEEYKAELAKQGYDIEGMKQPVLIQRRTQAMSPEDRIAFTEESNDPTLAEKGETEISGSDARKIDQSVTGLFMGGEVDQARNRDFVRAFMDKVVPKAQHGKMMTDEGLLSQTGIRRIENAMFTKAYGSDSLVSGLREDPDVTFKAIGQAMIDAAPGFARAKQNADITEITGALTNAVETVRKARESRKPITEFAGQVSMFASTTDRYMERQFLNLFFHGQSEFRRQRSRVAIADDLLKIASMIESNRDDASTDMFGAPTITPDRVVAEVLRQKERNDYVAGNAQDVLFSRVQGRVQSGDVATGPRPKKKGLSHSQVVGVVNRITSNWDPSKLPKITVVQNQSELPQSIKAAAGEAFDDGASGVRGVLWREEGEPVVYLVSDQFRNNREIKEAVAHEVVGHLSIEELLGDEFADLLYQVHKDRNKPVYRAVRGHVEKNYPGAPPATTAREMIARMAEIRTSSPLMTRIIAAVRKFLRSLGLDIAYSYDQVMDYLSKADRRMKDAPSSLDNEIAVDALWEGVYQRKVPDKPDPPLRATHTLSVENLTKAVENGSLLAPSVAITPANMPHRWKGDGSADVIFRAGAVNPETWDITRGDAWTATVPRTETRFTGNSKDLWRIIDKFQEDVNALSDARKKKHRLDPANSYYLFDLDTKTLDTDYTTDRAMHQVFQHKTGKRADESSTAYKVWREGYLDELTGGNVEESFRSGSDSMGRARYVKATPENIFKDMRKQSKEGGISFGGQAKIWARWRRGIKSMTALRGEAKNILRDKTLYEARKKELSDEILDIGREIAEIVGARGIFSFDTGLEILLEAGPNRERLNREVSYIKDEQVSISDDLYNRIVDHFAKASTMPLQFLEAKVIKKVPLSDVAMVIVPKGTSKPLVNRLKAKGIKVKTKDREMDDDQLAALQSSEDIVLFSRQPTARKAAKPALIEITRPLESMARLLAIGGRDEKGDWAAAKHIHKKAGEIVRSKTPDAEGPFSWATPHIELVRHGWLNRYNTPRDFVMRERMRMVQEHELMEEMLGFIKSIEEFDLTTEQAEALNEFLTTKEGKLDDQKLEELGGEIKASIEDMGAKMVEAGLLNQKTWRENIGEYMHRSYKKYEFDQPGLANWIKKHGTKRKNKIIGDELKQQGKVHRFQSRKMLLRDIDPKYHDMASEITDWEIHDMYDTLDGKVKRRLYVPHGHDELLKNDPRVYQAQKLLDDDDTGRVWVQQGDTWKIKKQGKGKEYLWSQYSEDEFNAMGLIRDARFNILKTYQLMAHDVATGKFYQDIADNPNWFHKKKPDWLDDEMILHDSNQWRGARTAVEYRFVKVPDTLIAKSNSKKWGALSGGLVRSEIWRDINELDKMQNPGTWGWMLSLWKESKTVLSPNVHFNNIMGNVILSELYDFSPGDIANAVIAMRDGKKNDTFKEAVKHGVFGSGYLQVELNRVGMKQVIDKIERDIEKAEGIERNQTMAKTAAIFGSIRKHMQDAYQIEDEIFRLASYIHDIDRGYTPEEASYNALKRFLDYDIRAPWPNALRRTVLPFFSYTYAFIPQAAKAIVAKPWKIAKIAALGYFIRYLSEQVVPGDEEEEMRVMHDRDKGMTWAGLPKMLRLPISQNGDPVYLGMQRFVPGGGILETDNNLLGVPEWLAVSGPLLTMSELLLNRSQFANRDIVNPVTDTGMEKTTKRLGYAYRSLAPNIPGMPGTWSTQNIMRAFGDDIDIFGREYSPSIALIRSLGPKLYPFDKNEQMTMRVLEISREQREIQANLQQYMRMHARKRISKSALDKQIKKTQRQTKKLQEKLIKLTK